jgi:hypothetical protein
LKYLVAEIDYSSAGITQMNAFAEAKNPDLEGFVEDIF